MDLYGSIILIMRIWGFYTYVYTSFALGCPSDKKLSSIITLQEQKHIRMGGFCNSAILVRIYHEYHALYMLCIDIAIVAKHVTESPIFSTAQ